MFLERKAAEGDDLVEENTVAPDVRHRGEDTVRWDQADVISLIRLFILYSLFNFSTDSKRKEKIVIPSKSEEMIKIHTFLNIFRVLFSI